MSLNPKFPPTCREKPHPDPKSSISRPRSRLTLGMAPQDHDHFTRRSRRLRRIGQRLPATSCKDKTQPVSPLLNLPVEILEQIVELATLTTHDPPQAALTPRYPRGRWYYALTKLRPIWGLRMSCRSLFHLTTPFVYESLDIVHHRDNHLYGLVSHLQEQASSSRPNSPLLIKDIFLANFNHRRVVWEEIAFIQRSAKQTHSILPPPKLLVATNKPGQNNYKRILQDSTLASLVDAVLVDLLLALTSRSLSRLTLEYDDNAGFGNHLANGITFPALQYLAVSGGFGVDSRDDFTLGALESILRRAPELRCITVSRCGAVSSGLKAQLCPRMENVVSMRFVDATFHVSDFAAIAQLCPNLTVFRYSGFKESESMWMERRGRYPPPFRNRCDRGAFCRAFLPLKRTLRYLDLELDVVARGYGLDCDFSQFRALEHLCLDVWRTRRSVCGENKIVSMLPRGIRSLSLLRLAGPMIGAVEGFVDEVLAGGFPQLKYFGHTHHADFGTVEGLEVALGVAGVVYGPGRVQRVDVESAGRLAAWEDLS